MTPVQTDSAAVLSGVSKRFGETDALRGLNAVLPAGVVTGIVGPDAAGKTTLMRLLAGLLSPTEGDVRVLGRPAVYTGGGSQPFVGYMPQKFGLYEDLSVIDNLNLHADLRNITRQERIPLFDRLLGFTSLAPFTARLAGRLSGGMKQKLGLACALLGSPRLLLLDEPGVGVDPGARRELWFMVQELVHEGMSVVWSTAYMDEAERCAFILMLSEGKSLYAGPPREWIETMRGRVFFEAPPRNGEARWIRRALSRWNADSRVTDSLAQGSRVRVVFRKEAEVPEFLTPAEPHLEDVYMDAVGGGSRNASVYAAFPAVPYWNAQAGALEPSCPPDESIVVEARNLTKRFGTFKAADNISFSVAPGKIFGLLGPNGAGKSTTFRMLCGLSRPTSGDCRVAGVDMLRSAGRARSHLGYMAQKFSLYGDLTPSRNIDLFASLYGVPDKIFQRRKRELVSMLGLAEYLNVQTALLPLGHKQRLALLCATIHAPRVLFLDEPTSGVDPRTRREFWKHIQALTQTGVAVVVTTHFMEEAEYCDDIALIFHGAVIASGSPDELKAAQRGAPGSPLADPTLEDAFIAYIDAYNQEHGA